MSDEARATIALEAWIDSTEEKDTATKRAILAALKSARDDEAEACARIAKEAAQECQDPDVAMQIVEPIVQRIYARIAARASEPNG